MEDRTATLEKQHIIDLAAQQIELYRRQGLELVSHYNREISALDGYRGRQLLELVQNADDAGVEAEADCTLLLDLSRERLVIANTGKPFSRKGLTSLVISDCSPKQLERNRFIGCKGLGFRSVLTWTDRPLISSGQYEVVFDRAKAIETIQKLAAELPELNEIVTQFCNSMGRWPAAMMRFPAVPSEDDPWLQMADDYRAQGYDTIVVLPLPEGTRGDAIHQEILEQLNGLPTSSLLFCRHLTGVKISGDLKRTWELAREIHSPERTTVIVQENGDTELWQVYWHAGQVSLATADTNSGGQRDFEVAVAVPEVPRAEVSGCLCVFFPTHERLPCSLVMHATLETTDDRNHLVNHASNREVLRQLACHVAKVVENQASPLNPLRALELLRGVENADPELKTLGFVDALVEECAKRAIFPRLDRTLRSGTDVRQAPHAIWLEELSLGLFPELLKVGPEGSLTGTLEMFNLSWFDAASLKDRLSRQLSDTGRGKAGEIVGRLLAANQLSEVGADCLLIGDDGSIMNGGGCFFTPTEKLPAIPPWASSIRFVDEEFQNGLLRGSEANGLRSLAVDLNRLNCEVDEYRFETVARALIDQVEQGLDGEFASKSQRWSELLRWLFEASRGAQQVLPQLIIKVITTRKTLQRATACYLGPDYPRGQIVWRLYERFGQDEFVGQASDNGLGGLATEDAERFLVALGVNADPRFEQFRSGSDYQSFLKAVVDRLDYPRTVRGQLCKTPDDVRRLCREYMIDHISVPDRWARLLREGDATSIAAYLLSTGGAFIAAEADSAAMFQARIGNEIKLWTDPSVPIPNATLFFLREVEWVPVADGKPRRPSGIMLSNQGVRILREVYARHALNAKDNLVVSHGGRGALEALLTRLGAVSSLETLSGQSLYELLLALPDRDPKGDVAPGIYRTLIESNLTADESSHRDRFLKSGQMWGRYKEAPPSYLPIGQLRYNANLTITRMIEAHIPLVDIPARKNTLLVKQLFGIAPLTSEDIQVDLVSEETDYDPGSEDANRRLRLAIPYVYALRLARNMDAGGRELNLLRNAVLRVCRRAQVAAKLPTGATEIINLEDPGAHIVIDTSLVVIGEYRQQGPSLLTFWLTVADLVAELLGTDVADEVGGILRCNNVSEMQEVLRVRLGPDADKKLELAKSRFDDSFKDDDAGTEKSIPLPRPAEQPGQPPLQSAPLASPGSSGIPGSGDTKDPGSMPGIDGTFQTITGPADRPGKRRKLVITGLGGGGGGRGPLATEDITFKVVEAFERYQGRFLISVSHLHGADGFGCDLISVASQAVRDQAIAQQSVRHEDVLRYIEVKGRSSRTGEVELTDNEYAAAERENTRYFLYRVYVDPNHVGHYEIAVLGDLLNSKAVRTVTRFDLAQGSGANWFTFFEVREDQEPDQNKEQD
ncbi:MAG: DUF3883 domain-containing protein [Dehalococcoidia bacterium]|nr:DUF3883 domain-containing protein [Dehalococcoidia bacterium]